MIKQLIKKLINLFDRPRDIYHPWLKDNKDVVGKLPVMTRRLADDIILELYLGDSAIGRDSYATAVIAVKVGNKTYRSKYDGGRINNDLEEMAQECVDNIKAGWDLDFFRSSARKEIK